MKELIIFAISTALLIYFGTAWFKNKALRRSKIEMDTDFTTLDDKEIQAMKEAGELDADFTFCPPELRARTIKN